MNIILRTRSCLCIAGLLVFPELSNVLCLGSNYSYGTGILSQSERNIYLDAYEPLDLFVTVHTQQQASLMCTHASDVRRHKMIHSEFLQAELTQIYLLIVVTYIC